VVGYTDYPFLSQIDQAKTEVVDHRGVKVFDVPILSEKPVVVPKFS
jgi:hypothetical protein